MTMRDRAAWPGTRAPYSQVRRRWLKSDDMRRKSVTTHVCRPSRRGSTSRPKGLRTPYGELSD